LASRRILQSTMKDQIMTTEDPSKRYVVLFKDPSARSIYHDRITHIPGIRVLQEITNRVMLIEAPAYAIAAVRRAGTDRVSISEETTHRAPGLTRPGIRR
jgi:hypothetical protein